MTHKCQICVNELQSYPTIQYIWNTPIMECFQRVNQAGSTDKNASFGLLWLFVTWESSLPYPQHLFWYTEVLNISKLYHGLATSPTHTDLCFMFGQNKPSAPEMKQENFRFFHKLITALISNLPL